MKLSLVSYWKECWKLTSFQLSIVVIALEWLPNLTTQMPQTPQEWTQAIGILLLPVFRLMKQTNIQGA